MSFDSLSEEKIVTASLEKIELYDMVKNIVIEEQSKSN